VRREVLQNLETLCWGRERVRQYGVAGLFPDSHNDFPFVLYIQSVSRPAWSGKKDFHREKLHQVYELLIATSCGEIQEREAVGNTADAFDASGCFPAFEMNVCVDAVPTGE
jgi:hypothetical protein